MNYTEAKAYLKTVSKTGSVYGLKTVEELLKRLGNPQNSLKFVHIAGTNGKGSLLAYVSTVLAEAGYRTGRYSSPALLSQRETVQVNGEPIEKESFAALVTKIEQASSAMKNEGLAPPTCFEAETALAFLYFKEKNCDIAVLETGLGGAQDATNIVSTTVLEIFVPVSLDHTDLLGDTLKKIAEEKAGIIKPETAVVSAVQPVEVAAVLERVCKEKSCSFRCTETAKIHDVVYGCKEQIFSYKNRKSVKISLAGSYQIQNACLALEALDALKETGFKIPEEALLRGMKNTAWWGRFSQIAENPAVILDGAHNPAAATELRKSLNLYFKGKRLFYIFGVFKDKEYKKIIELTAPLAEHIITVQTPGNPRALPAEDLKKEVENVNPSVEAADSIAAAVKKLRQMTGKDDAIVIFGSLSFLGEAKKAVLKEEDHE